MLLSLIIISSVCAILLFFRFSQIKDAIRSYVLVHKLDGPPRSNIVVGNITCIQGTPGTMYFVQRKTIYTSFSEKIFTTLRELAQKFYPIYKIFSVYKGSANIVSPEDCEVNSLLHILENQSILLCS